MGLNITFFLDYYQPPSTRRKVHRFPNADSPFHRFTHTRLQDPTPPTKHLSVNQVPLRAGEIVSSFSLSTTRALLPTLAFFFNSDSFRQMRSPGMPFARRQSKEKGKQMWS